MSLDRERLEIPCRQLVAFKDHLDAMLKHSAAAGLRLPLAGQAFAGLQPRGHTRHYIGAICPTDFIRFALPFADRESIRGPHVEDAVDPRLILAGTYGNYDPHAWLFERNISPDGVMDRSDQLVLESEGDAHGHPEMPRIVKLGELPLYVSCEGKNRVSLFKQFRIRMRVFVKQCSFPQPDELRLVPLRPFDQLGVEGFGEICPLPFPSIVGPLLQTYGVQLVKPRLFFGAWKLAKSARQKIVNAQMVR